MAKKIKIKKSVKKPIKRLKKRKTNYGFKKAFAVLILLILSILAFNYVFKISKLSHPNFSKEISTKTIQQNKKELITPYPSVSVKVTPTPIPLTGFCLHVPVLMYHHIQPQSNAKQLGQVALTVDSEIFDEQMKYLSQNGYKTLFAWELVNALINKQNLPEKSIVITMDDGYEDNFIYALPILQKYNLKANIALSSGLMNNSNMLSWDEVGKLKSSGLIGFTNHTWSHQSVIRGAKAKIEMEIDTAKKEIEEKTTQNVDVFTYPYGEVNEASINILRSKGYLGAFSEIPGQYQCDSFLMTLHRTRVGNSSLSSYGI